MLKPFPSSRWRFEYRAESLIASWNVRSGIRQLRFKNEQSVGLKRQAPGRVKADAHPSNAKRYQPANAQLFGVRVGRLHLRLVAFLPEQPAFEGEVAVLGEDRLEVGDDLLGGCGVGIEQVDR